MAGLTSNGGMGHTNSGGSTWPTLTPLPCKVESNCLTKVTPIVSRSPARRDKLTLHSRITIRDFTSEITRNRTISKGFSPESKGHRTLRPPGLKLRPGVYNQYTFVKVWTPLNYSLLSVGVRCFSRT